MTDLWNFLLVHPLLSLLIAAYDLIPDFGLAIVLLTVGIRLVLYPLFVAQIRSQRAMQEVAPALNELKQKYGKDRQRMGEEQMKLYRERGVNPAMGCLPLLIQMPILFAMYAAFLQVGGGLGQEPLKGSDYARFLPPFIPNPVGPDETLDLTAHWLPWLTGGLGQADPGLFIEYFKVLPILAGLTQLIASIMAMPADQPKSQDPQAKMMQSMAYYFPIITVVFAWSFPSGLAVYWVTTTVFQIVQQYVVTGWGQLARWLPFLKKIPTPADRGMRRAQRAAIEEAHADMKAAGAHADAGTTNGEGARRRGRRKRRRG
ncbi:MAG: YidC/Oxa1 family membrane protein insertase [Chloroflexota bacterium]